MSAAQLTGRGITFKTFPEDAMGIIHSTLTVPATTRNNNTEIVCINEILHGSDPAILRLQGTVMAD